MSIDFNKYGPPGSSERLQAIVNYGSSVCSDAALRVLNNRNRRKELMEKGIPHNLACLIVERENKQEWPNT